PRRVRRLAPGGHCRHERPRLPAALLRRISAAAARERRRARDRLGAHLPADGGGAVLPAAGPLPGARLMRAIAVFLLLAIFPLVMQAMDNLFYVSFASRVLIYAIAATSLNLVLGYGGMDEDAAREEIGRAHV